MKSVCVMVIFAVCLAVLPRNVEAKAVGVDLTGKWRLNRELSDNPQEVMKKQREEMRSRLGGRGGMGDMGDMGAGRGGGMRGGPPGGGRPGGPPPDMDRAGAKTPFESLELVEIREAADGLSFVHASGDTTVVIPDGVERSQETRFGPAAVTAYWHDLELVVTAEPKRGGQHRRIYTIDDDGRLVIVNAITNERFGEPIHIKSVYDPVSEGSNR